MLRRTQTLLLCQIFVILIFSSVSQAWNPIQASSNTNHGAVVSPPGTGYGTGWKMEPRKIIKCRPLAHDRQAIGGLGGHYSASRSSEHSTSNASGHGSECSLPEHPTGGWELAADVLFARNKGKVRFSTGIIWGSYGLDDIDLNADLGMDDHGVMASFMAMYRFRPKWSFRYSVMPMTMMGSGQAGKSFVFGNAQYTAGQQVNMEWQHLEQRFGLVYDAVHAHSARLSLFGEYVRVADRIKVMQMQTGMGSGIMDNDLNMAMAGAEFEKCLKATRTKATLSLECKAGGYFLDDAVGMEAETALRYSIPMNCRRWGFLKGGYRYLTYKTKSSDARMFDIAMEGGFLQMGLIF